MTRLDVFRAENVGEILIILGVCVLDEFGTYPPPIKFRWGGGEVWKMSPQLLGKLGQCWLLCFSPQQCFGTPASRGPVKGNLWISVLRPGLLCVEGAA